jgi:cation diffusion facilitator family transporter
LNSEQQNLRLQKIITAVGAVLFVIKMLAWYFTNSVAILTDALESIVNVVAGLIGVYSLYVSAKPKDRDHPYGHGKAEFLSAAVEGTLIIVAGILVIYKAGKSIFHPEPINKLDYGIILVIGTAIVNYVMGFVCVQTGKKNNSAALVASGKHLKTDTYTTAGIIAGLILLYFFKYRWIDSAIALLFAVIIMITGYRIMRSSIAGIMDEVDTKLLNKMVATLNVSRRENWIDLHNLRIIKFGGRLHLDCHLTVPWYLNVNEAHAEIEALSSLVKKEFGSSMELFVHSDPCLEFSCRICTKQDCNVRQHAFERKIIWTMENISTDNKHHL